VARLTANFDLMLELVRQIEPKDGNWVPPEADRPSELERRAKRAIEVTGSRLGDSSELVVASLERVATIFAGIGVGRNIRTARIPATIASIMQLRQELVEHAQRHADNNGPEADVVASVADLTTTLARIMLAQAQALTGDIVALLRRWVIEPEALAKLLARSDWLLDGWDRICALWRTAESHLGRGRALIEMAGLVPLVPHEVVEWTDQQIEVDATYLLCHRRKVVLLED
jgi:hypothetical protein